MATDATGTPTTLGIPTYDIAVDAPSGNGFNAAMSEIDTLLQARATVASPAFSGSPTAPTQPLTDNSTKIATTGFVQGQDFASLSAAATQVFTGSVATPTLNALGLTGTVQARQVGGTAGGAPATGTFQIRDVSVDSTGQIWVCTAGGSPGTWKAVGSSGNLVTSAFGRTGAVVATTGDYTAAQVTNAADKASAGIQTFTSDVAAPNFLMGNAPQSANGTTSVTPLVDTEGSLYITHTGGGTLTINNPGHFPGVGESQFFTLTVLSSAAGTTMAWGNAYKFGSGLIINNTLTAGQTQTWLFMLVGDESQAICLLNTGTF